MIIGHRLRAVLAHQSGAQALSVLAYGIDEVMPPGLIDRPGGTDEWLLMGFSTSAFAWVDGPGGITSERAVDGQSLLWWRPLAPHRYGHPHLRWRHSWIMFDGDHIRTRAATIGLPLEVPIGGIPTAWLDACIHGIHEEITSQARPDPQILAAHLDILLRRAARAVSKPGGSMVPPGLLAVRSRIETHFTETVRLPALARLAGCSVPHLCAGFRKHFAVTPIDLVIRLRLDHARRLLSERGQTVAAVAARVGYADYHHFTRLYRRHFGHSPRQRALSVCEPDAPTP